MEEFKEREVGEVFEYEGVTLKCEEDISGSCFGCFFEKDRYCSDKIASCAWDNREDKTEVKYIKQ